MRQARVLFVLFASMLLSISPAWNAAQAQNANMVRPIDMEILIDNSCSMFPASQKLPGCDASGADPDFLRINGADLFIARLGFGEQSEAEYQLGVISIGDKPERISPLAPLSKIRNELANKIANPKPQPATKLVPALQMGFDDLNKSTFAATHQPALVLITDGIPWPREGQSDADIEELITRYPDVPLFVMVLANKTKTSPDFENYIRFWESLSARVTNVHVYRILEAGEIEDTYNRILGQLQNTIPAEGVDVPKGTQTSLYIGEYVQKVIVTVIRKTGQAEGAVTIKDPKGVPVTDQEGGVKYFHGKQNPVEVYSIEAPRLSKDLKGKAWTINASSAVTMIIDRVGSYRINILNPQVKLVDISNQYQSLELQSPSQDISIQFNLLDESGKAVIDPQLIRGSVTSPDGTTIDLLDQTINPDAKGMYKLSLSLGVLFPGGDTQTGRYSFQLSAGVIDEKSNTSPALASAQLYMDVLNYPYIRSVAPLPITCQSGQPAELRVNVGDLSAEGGDTVSIQVMSGNLTIPIPAKENGLYRGDVTQLCEALIARAGCSVSQNISFTVQMDVSLASGTVLPPAQRQVNADVTGLSCTATPLPTATALPAPTPTPIADSDMDGFNNLSDRCPSQWGLAQYGGCFPWSMVLGGSGAIALVALLGVIFWPWMKVTRISPPSPAYMVACRDGVQLFDPIALHEFSVSKHSPKITIGSRKRRTGIYVEGLQVVEFFVEWKDGTVSLRVPTENEAFLYFGEQVRTVRTSNPKVTLRISLNPDSLAC